jgi:hypothetical protein
MQPPDAGIPIQLIPPEALEGTEGVVWRAQDGKRTTTQIATHVRYALRMTPNRKNMLGHTVILPPSWQGTLEVSRKDSYLQPKTEIVLTTDDGRQVSGFIRSVRGLRTQRADVTINGWLEDWV